jgi:hypothetical protein
VRGESEGVVWGERERVVRGFGSESDSRRSRKQTGHSVMMMWTVSRQAECCGMFSIGMDLNLYCGGVWEEGGGE